MQAASDGHARCLAGRVWAVPSGIILVRRLYMPPEPRSQGWGGRTARLWLQPTPSTYLYMFFQIRFQTSARRLIRSDLSDGIGRIQIRPHILGWRAGVLAPSRQIERVLLIVHDDTRS